MKLGSKRWHHARRSKWRRGCRIARRILAAELDLTDERQARRHNAAVRWLNRRVATTRDGLPICDGIAECPRCRRAVAMMADPQEWQRPRHGRRWWQVTGYWGGTAECCDLLIADNFDHTVVIDLAASRS